MSVKVIDRQESRTEAVEQAMEVRRLLKELGHRNFGIRDLDHMVRARYKYQGKEKDGRRYMVELEQAKKRLILLGDQLIAQTRNARKVKLSSFRRCEKRAALQEDALLTCDALHGKLIDIAETFELDLNTFRLAVEAIDYEIALVTKWLQYTNRIKRKITR